MKNHRARIAHTDTGFTLLELLVVLVIIGLLAGYVGPRFFAQIGKSETKTAQAQITAIGKALDAYRIDMGQYPSTEQGLQALSSQPSGLNSSRWSGPYLQKAAPLDPWGRAYVYKSPGSNGDYDLFTFGKDGSVGGANESQDIHN